MTLTRLVNGKGLLTVPRAEDPMTIFICNVFVKCYFNILLIILVSFCRDYGERISFEENVGYGAGASKDSKVDDFTKDGLQNPSKSLRVDVAKVDFSTSKKTEVTPKDVLVRLTNIVGNINQARVATQQSTP